MGRINAFNEPHDHSHDKSPLENSNPFRIALIQRTEEAWRPLWNAHWDNFTREVCKNLGLEDL